MWANDMSVNFLAVTTELTKKVLGSIAVNKLIKHFFSQKPQKTSQVWAIRRRRNIANWATFTLQALMSSLDLLLESNFFCLAVHRLWTYG